jgi:lipopolysaccharide export system permease protein
MKLYLNRRKGLQGCVLDRYVLREIFPLLVGGIVGGTILLLSNQVLLYADLLVEKGVPLGSILQLFVLNLPAIVIVTVPLASLFATLLVLGRLGADSEIVALQAAGVSPLRLVASLFLLGLLLSAIAFGLNDTLVPLANRRASHLGWQLARRPDVLLVEPQTLVSIGPLQWVYADGVSSNRQTLHNIVLFDRQGIYAPRRFPQLVLADTATRAATTWNLQNVRIYRYSDDGSAALHRQMDSLQWDMGQQIDTLRQQPLPPQALSSRELRQQIHLLSEQGVVPSALAPLRGEWHLKFALPFASVCAIAIAAPLGLRSPRTVGRYGSVALAIALTFAYYLLLSLSRSLGQALLLPPLVAAWLPNGICLALGAAMFRWGWALSLRRGAH